MTLNAKERFQKSPQAKVFAEMVNIEAFKTALEYAFLEWSNTLKPLCTNELDGVYQSYKSEGIRDYIKILINLNEPEEIPQTPIQQNLKPV